MHYLIGRDLDGDGAYEFIQDMDSMILTEDANRALQVTSNELAYIDMDYLNESGFYALEADRFQVSLLEALLFSPLVRGYRPRIAPPPRRPRRRRPTPPPRNHLLGMFGIPLPPKPPRPPKPRPVARRKPPKPTPKPRGAAPGGFGMAPGMGRGPAKPAGPRHKKSSARTPGGAGRPGGRGHGGRGPGR